MTSLLSLPTELIIQVFASCPTVYTAACLSAANKELRAIWLKHTDQILERTLRDTLPGYEDAVDLANMQRSLLSPEQSTDATQTPDYQYYRRLLHDAKLASPLIAEWKKDIKRDPDQFTWRRRIPQDPHISYYLIRKLILTPYCRDKQVKRELYSTLSAAPFHLVQSHNDLMEFLNFKTFDPEDWEMLHGVPDDDNFDNDERENDIPPQMYYPSEVTYAAFKDRMEGTHELEDAIFYDHPCAIAARERPPGHGVLFKDYYGF
jgi:hypothetical protein